MGCVSGAMLWMLFHNALDAGLYSDSSSWMTYSGEGIRGRCACPWWRRPERERDDRFGDGRLGTGAWMIGVLADLDEDE